MLAVDERKMVEYIMKKLGWKKLFVTQAHVEIVLALELEYLKSIGVAYEE